MQLRREMLDRISVRPPTATTETPWPRGPRGWHIVWLGETSLQGSARSGGQFSAASIYERVPNGYEHPSSNPSMHTCLRIPLAKG